ALWFVRPIIQPSSCPAKSLRFIQAADTIIHKPSELYENSGGLCNYLSSRRSGMKFCVRRAIVPACWWLSLSSVFLISSWVQADDDSRDSVMYKDPEVRIANITRAFPPDLVEAWLVGLRRPETDYQSRAALTILLAHQHGMKGLEVMIDPLVEIPTGPAHHE